MSRIGKNPVEVPGGVTLEINGQDVSAKGKLGQLSVTMMDEVEITREDNLVWIKPRAEGKRFRQMWGTGRTMVQNLVTGVSEGFTRKLEISGVGYRAAMQGKDLVLQLGYSHEVRFPVPEGLSIECPDQTHISITGADKQKVGQAAAKIRSFRGPEPYKGKGVKYAEEVILRKEGKKK